MTAYFLPGITISGSWTTFEGWRIAAFMAVTLTVLSFTIKPVLFVLTLPINIITFGLFSFVLNGAIFYLAARFVTGFSVSSFWVAVLGAIVISLFHWFINKVLDSAEN